MRIVDRKKMLLISDSRNQPIQSSKEQINQTSQTACLYFVSFQWLLWSADLGCVSLRTCGYRTRKLLLCLGGTRQGALHRNGFAGIHPDAAGWFSERRGPSGRGSRNWLRKSWSEFITILFNKRRRAVHGFISGTVVVRTRPNA